MLLFSHNVYIHKFTCIFNYLEKESECLQLKILVLREMNWKRQKKALGREAVLLHKEQIALQDKVSEIPDTLLASMFSNFPFHPGLQIVIFYKFTKTNYKNFLKYFLKLIHKVYIRAHTHFTFSN